MEKTAQLKNVKFTNFKPRCIDAWTYFNGDSWGR